MIEHIRVGVDQNLERSFLLDLLFKLDRSGPRQDAYNHGYLKFASALKTLREQSAIIDVDLVLRECVFRRRAVVHEQYGEAPNSRGVDIPVVLNEARDMIEVALRDIDRRDVRVARKTRSSLLAERSAIYGYLAVQRARSGAATECWSDYLAARAAGENAVGIGGDYYPLDIALWTGGDILKAKGRELSDAQRAEVLANLHETMDLADDVFKVRSPRTAGIPKSEDGANGDDFVSAVQRVRYLERRQEVANVMGDVDLSEESLTALEEVAPSAVTFLRAKSMGSVVYLVDPPFDTTVRVAAANAANYIADRVGAGVLLDTRCQRLLVRLRWAESTGERLMYAQRGRMPTIQAHIDELLDTIGQLNENAGRDARNRERFLEAVLCWLRRDFNRANDLWNSLSSDTEYEDKSRVIRWLVATTSDGRPVRYRGRVEGRHRNAWRVRVEGINRTIAIRANDFGQEDLSHGRELRDFGIAFNFIGPIADPLVHRVGRRR